MGRFPCNPGTLSPTVAGLGLAAGPPVRPVGNLCGVLAHLASAFPPPTHLPPSSPAARGYGSVGVVHLVGVDGGEHAALQIPDDHSGVIGGRHDELPWEKQGQTPELRTTPSSTHILSETQRPPLFPSQARLWRFSACPSYLLWLPTLQGNKTQSPDMDLGAQAGLERALSCAHLLSISHLCPQCQC